jgi:hypothetical protein
LTALNAYWLQNPPLHLLAKTWMGYKGGPTEASVERAMPAASAGDIMDSLIDDGSSAER